MEKELDNSITENYFELKQNDEYFKILLLNKEEVDRLMVGNNAIQIKNQILVDNSLEAFKLKDGKVLVMRQGDDEFPLYPSEQILIKQLESHDPTPKPIFEGVNIYGEHFPNKASKLSKDFLQKCGVTNYEKKDQEILEQVDRYINNNRTAKFLDENFLSLVALIGELVNRSYDTNWLMLYSGYWIPNLSIGKTQIYFADFIFDNYESRNVKSPILESYESVVAIVQFNSPALVRVPTNRNDGTAGR